MTIRTIVKDVIATRVFTNQQEETINALMQSHQFNADDVKLLGRLIDALREGTILIIDE